MLFLSMSLYSSMPRPVFLITVCFFHQSSMILSYIRNFSDTSGVLCITISLFRGDYEKICSVFRTGRDSAYPAAPSVFDRFIRYLYFRRTICGAVLWCADLACVADLFRFCRTQKISGQCPLSGCDPVFILRFLWSFSGGRLRILFLPCRYSCSVHLVRSAVRCGCVRRPSCFTRRRSCCNSGMHALSFARNRIFRVCSGSIREKEEKETLSS